jgi:hypothetical protein
MAPLARVLLAGITGILITTNASHAHAEAPICDGNWHFVYVPGSVCLDGTPTGFSYACSAALGPRAPLLIYFESGGGCWDADTCDCQYSYASCLDNAPWCCTNMANVAFTTNHYGIENSCDGQPYGACKGAADSGVYALNGDIGQEAAFNSSTSGFNTTGGSGSGGLNHWNMVNIHYCTADVHMGGGETYTWTSNLGNTYTATFNGYNNAVLDITRIQSLFPKASKVALWGSSAGGSGVTCNMQQVANAFPQLGYAFADANAPIDSQFSPGFPAVFEKWGAVKPGKDGRVIGLTCPIPDGSMGPYGTDLVAQSNVQRLPQVRQALSEDYSDSTMDFFYCLMGAPQNAQGSCASSLTASMLDTLADSIGPNNPTYKVFYHTGLCHAEREADTNGLQCVSGPNAYFGCVCPAGATSCDDVAHCGAGTSACAVDPGNCNYDTMVQNGVHLNDWVRAWLQTPGFSSWDDVK